MNWSNIITVYAKELKDSLRDRRTLMSMIIIPTFVMPALIFGVGKIATTVFSKARSEIPTVMVLGGETSPGVVAALGDSKKVNIVPTAADWKQQISDKKIRATVQLPVNFERDLAAGAAESVIIYNYDGELKSGFAANELEKFFRTLRERAVATQLARRGLPATLIQPFETKRENVAPPEKVGGNLLGGIVPYLIIILCFTGAMYPAMDLTAGEKERGTMETLLCSPVARVDIVLGKFLMVLTSSLAAMVLALTSMGVSFAVGGAIFSGGGAKVAVVGKVADATSAAASSVMPSIDPAGVLGVLAMVLPVAVLFSAVIFTVALFAKSYKEAQSYVAPLIFVVIMPAVVGMLPGIELNARLALVPILNLSLVCKEMLSGIWHWNYIAIIFGSTCVYAGVALALAVKMFDREDVIFRA
ncbi:MAG: ABC transporter permease [Undibacterium sp.]|nr:ABC transporter permease [Opitutaceae bacterium]